VNDLDLSEIRKQIVTLSARRGVLEKELLEFRYPMAKGSVYLQYTSCAKAGCRCMRGEKHGPFYFMSVKKNGKTVRRYLGKNIKPNLATRYQRYLEFGKLVHALRKLDRQITVLWNQFRECLVKEG
jgi:hypothetical protein